MSTILYGNLSVAIVDDLGVLLDRPRARPAAAELLKPKRAPAPSLPPMLGRNRELADAFSALHARRPVEFHASCGYGKSTLLQRIVATASARGIALNCLYLRMDTDRVDDLLHELVTTLFSSVRPVKLTQDECAQVLGQVSAIIAIDDMSAGPDRAGYLLDVLPGCDLVLGAPRATLGRRGTSQDLAGLPDETALALLADRLGRPLPEEERPAARRLVDAVDGQPLHLRQAAALARDGGHSIESLAQRAEDDPDVLDRLSVNGLAEVQRRALAVLALAAGALVPADVVEAIGSIADLGECLDSLHRRGLVERHADRFGVPVCKAASYRQMLLKYLSLASAAHELATLLVAHDPTASESGPTADAALSIIEFAADQGEWTTVATLAKAAESVLFLAGRWEAWKHVLGRGLDAARAIGDGAAEAFFAHQLGSLAFCGDDLDGALQLLQHARDLRLRLGDQEGADRTRHNLGLLQAPPPPPPRGPRTRIRRRGLTALAGVVGTLVLAVASVAIAGTLHHHGPHPVPTAGRTVPTATSASPTQDAATSASAVQTPATSVPTTHAPTTLAPTTQVPTTQAPTTTVPTTTVPTTTGPTTATPTPVTVADVVGQSRSAGTAILTDQGLTVSPGTTTDCTAAESGTVVAQSPTGGSAAASGSAVSITVCTVSAPVTVPDVIGDSQSDATTTLQALGFGVTPVTTTTCSTDDSDRVVSQSPLSGNAAASGSAVTITVCVDTTD